MGASQRQAFTGSRLGVPDWIRDFRPGLGDRILLDYGAGFVRPTGLCNAGTVVGGNVLAATRSAFADKNQRQAGRQVLRGNEAVCFRWGSRSYLAVNDANAGFFTAADLVVNVTGIGLTASQQRAGVLPVPSWFA